MRAKAAAPGPGRPKSLALSLLGGLVANPVGTAGGVLMAVTAGLIASNALGNQPGAHPAPLFPGMRPAGAPVVEDRTGSLPAAPDADDIDGLIADTTGRAPPTFDRALVADIQAELKVLGFYTGEVDGLPGPMTSAAILDFEKANGLTATGEPSEDLKAILQTGDTDARSAPQPPPAAAAPAPAPAPLAAVPAPRKRPPAEAADPIAATLANVTVPAPPEAPAAAPSADPLADLLASADNTAAAPAGAPVRPDARLARIQNALASNGYGPLTVDGLWGAATRDAIRRFEAHRGLPETGQLSAAFVAELKKIGAI